MGCICHQRWIVLNLQLVRAAAARALTKTSVSCQLLIDALLDEALKVREAAADQLVLLFPSIAELSLCQRCSVIRAAASTPALGAAIAKWHASVDAQGVAPAPPSTTVPSGHDSRRLRLCELLDEHPDDADLQALAKALVLVSYVQPVQNEGGPLMPPAWFA